VGMWWGGEKRGVKSCVEVGKGSSGEIVGGGRVAGGMGGERDRKWDKVTRRKMGGGGCLGGSGREGGSLERGGA